MQKVGNRVTVIVPLYHQAKYLAKAVDSVLGQTFKNWRMIIINDCGDNYDRAEAEAQAKRDKRISVVHHSVNMGLSATRNTGIMGAKGKYIQFLDADDWIDATKFEKQVALMEAEESDISHTDFYHVGESGTLNYGCTYFRHDSPEWEFTHHWENGLCIAIHSMMLKGSVFEEIGLFDETLENHEDQDMWIRMSKKEYKYSYLPEPLASYRIHSESICRTTDMEKGKRMVMEKNK
jgi:glycosyltransferase involved in cell wall biosynthesis